MKKIVSMMSAGVMTFCCGAGAPSALRSAALASGMPTTTSSSATSGPDRAGHDQRAMAADRATSAAMMAGATAPPRKPAKVWIENARPIRASSICADRIA